MIDNSDLIVEDDVLYAVTPMAIIDRDVKVLCERVSTWYEWFVNIMELKNKRGKGQTRCEEDSHFCFELYFMQFRGLINLTGGEL